MILLRRVNDDRGRGFQAFVEGHLVVGDAIFEGEFYPTETYVSADHHEYEGRGYVRGPNRYRVYEAVGELKFLGIHDPGCDTFYYLDIKNAPDARKCKQTVLKEKPAHLKG